MDDANKDVLKNHVLGLSAALLEIDKINKNWVKDLNVVMGEINTHADRIIELGESDLADVLKQVKDGAECDE